MTAEQWAAIAAGASAATATATLGHILYQHWYEQNQEQRGILISFARRTFDLDHCKDLDLPNTWYRIEAHWTHRGTIEAIATLREAIEKFHAPSEWYHELPSAIDGVGINQCRTAFNIFSDKRRELRRVNELRVELCKQMRKDMWPRRPRLGEIVPFVAHIQNPG